MSVLGRALARYFKGVGHRGAGRLWLGVSALVFFLLLWVSQSVRSTQLSYQIQKVEEEIKKELKRQAELKWHADRILSLETLEAAARKKFNLAPPKEENVVIMTLADPS